MSCLDLRYQALILLAAVLVFLLLKATGVLNESFNRRFAYFFKHFGGPLFFVCNLLGILTTNLLSMSYLHISELTILTLVFVHELLFGGYRLPRKAHHVLSLIGLVLQMHIGVGGALMSYLLIDQVTDLIRDRRIFWVVFLLVRLLGYNAVLAIAVKQGVEPAKESPAVRGWLACVIVWWVFSLFYHVQWAWKERDEISRLFFRGKKTEGRE